VVAEELGVTHPIYTRNKGKIEDTLTSNFYLEHHFSKSKAMSVKDIIGEDKNRTK
jgi:hypothetical protein